MSISALHQDETLRRKEFPVVGESVFLGHGGVCPIPRRAAAAVVQYASDTMKGDQEAVFQHSVMAETRGLASVLMGCTPEEVALVGPTSIALSLVANGLDWQRGDNVIFYEEDYPSNAVPWMALESRGVQLRPVKTPRLGEISLEDVMPLVDARTRLVALASAHFIGGYRLDIDQIGGWLRGRGILFCVDGIQTLGALRTSVAHVDFLAADAHKWLLGPCAAGIFFVRQESQAKLRPTLLGWNNVRCPGFVTPKLVEFPDHAGRYEAGSPSLLGIVGMHASLKLLAEYGAEAVEAAILEHTRFLRGELRRRGYELAGSCDENISGLTSFRRSDVDMAVLHRKLADAGIVASLRQTRDGLRWIRFSPHFYNTRGELERAVGLL